MSMELRIPELQAVLDWQIRVEKTLNELIEIHNLKVYTAAEAQDILKVSYATLRRLINSGKLLTLDNSSGGKIRISHKALSEYINNQSK